MLEENNVRKGFFEHDEYLRMNRALPEDVRPLLVFCLSHPAVEGRDPVPAMGQVDLSERLVRLHPGTTKNDEPGSSPSPGEVHEMLEAQKRTRDAEFPHCEFVFSRDGRPIREFPQVLGSSVYPGKTGQQLRRCIQMFHDLRRTGVRNLIRAGVPEKTAMAISGHKTRSVFDRYNIVSEGDLKERRPSWQPT